QTETEATGAPQKHHYTLNQQVGSITNYVYIFLKLFFSMNANNEDINGRIINGSPIYISRIKKPALRQVFIITDTLTAAEKYPPPAGTVHAVWTAASDG
ncbi:hypothetical protein NXH33_25775, partial [Klebsiella pneumoniae]|nr:hypothetical protein [Klebsiella pneumoniae]